MRFQRFQIKPIIFFSVIVSSILGLLSIAPSGESHKISVQNDSFYQIVFNIQDLPFSAKTSSLKTFLNKNPTFPPVYQLILEAYKNNDRIADAKRYFSSLKNTHPYQQNSNWMIAEISWTQEDPDLAARAFLNAVQTEIPSLELLMRFFYFAHVSGKSKTPELQTRLSEICKRRPEADVIMSYVKKEFRDAISKYDHLPDSLKNNTIILRAVGNSYNFLEKYGKAYEQYYAGLELSRKTGDKKSEIHFLQAIGEIYINSNTYENAIDMLDSALVIAKKIGDLIYSQRAARHLGIVYSSRGEYDQAKLYFYEALEISKKRDDNREAAYLFSRLAELNLELKRFDLALRYFDECGRLAKDSGNEFMLPGAALGRADVYLNTGHFDLAEIALQEATVLAEEKDWAGKYLRQAKIRRALLEFRKGNYQESREICEALLQSPKYQTGFKTHRSFWHYCIGRTYLEERQLPLAEKHFIKAFEIATAAQYDQNAAMSLVGLAKVELLSDQPDSALMFLQQSLTIAIANTDSSTLPLVRLTLGDVNQYQMEFAKAITHYRTTAQIIERNRKNLTVEQFRIEYFIETSDVNKKLVNCFKELFKQEKKPAYLDSIFTYIEKSRARTLQDSRTEKRVRVAEIADPELKAAYEKAVLDLQQKQRYVRDNAWALLAENKGDSAAAEVEIARISLIGLQLRIMNLDGAQESGKPDFQQSLSDIIQYSEEEDAGVLLYHISENGSLVLAITKAGADIIPLNIDPEELDSSITNLLAPFHNMDNQPILEVPFKAEIAHQLYQSLIAPIEAAVSLPERLIIVPDASLMNLPFEMLLSKEQRQREYLPKDQPEYADDFLQHRYAFTYSPTTKLMESGINWPSFTAPSILAYANPIDKEAYFSQLDRYGGQRIEDRGFDFQFRAGLLMTPLQFAELEADKIKKRHSETIIRKNLQATESLFMQEAPNHEILHLATHGFADMDHDEFCSLVLAPADSLSDGILMGYEIENLALSNCQLVTLSACETARGKLAAGEGVLGLPRLFLRAGAKSVLMTHWNVADKFTSELMPVFYDFHLNQNIPRADALAKTRRKLLEDRENKISAQYKHPLFWASFALYGDPGKSRNEIFTAQNLLYGFVILLFMIFLGRTFLENRQNPGTTN